MTNIAVVVFSRSPASGECPHCVLLVVIFPWQCNNYLHSRRSTGVGCSRFGFEAWAMRVGLTGGQALPITLSVASFLVGRLPRGGQPLCATSAQLSLIRSAMAVFRKIGGETTFGFEPVGMWRTNRSSSGLLKGPEKGCGCRMNKSASGP